MTAVIKEDLKEHYAKFPTLKCDKCDTVYGGFADMVNSTCVYCTGGTMRPMTIEEAEAVVTGPPIVRDP